MPVNHQTTTMFVNLQARGDFDDRPAMLLSIIAVCILMYSCVTFGDDRCVFMANDSLPNSKEAETEGPATCVFTSVDYDRERIVVGKLIYIVHLWYRLDVYPRRYRAQVYENTRAALPIRDISITMEYIKALRKRRTDPDDRVGSGACWPAAKVILVSEVAKKEDVNSDDDKDIDK